MQPPAKEQPVVQSPWMTFNQTATHTRLSPRSLARRLEIPRHKVGGKVLFHRDEVDAALLALSAK